MSFQHKNTFQYAWQREVLPKKPVHSQNLTGQLKCLISMSHCENGHWDMFSTGLAEAGGLSVKLLSAPPFMQDPPPPPTHFNVSRTQRLSDSSSSFWDSCSKFEKVILVLVLFLVMWNIILMGVTGATLHRVLTRV